MNFFNISGYNASRKGDAYGVKLGGSQKLDTFFQTYGRLLMYSKNEVVLHPTNAPKDFYYLQSGFIKSYDLTRQGACNLLFIYKAGEAFPLQLTLDGQGDGLFYEAMTPVELRVIQTTTLLRHARQDRVLDRALAEQLLSLLYKYTNRIKNLEYRTARERIMFRLWELVQRFGLESSDGLIIGAPITHQDIADSVNVTRETASREVQRLAQDGILRQFNHLLIVKDVERLREEFS